MKKITEIKFTCPVAKDKRQAFFENETDADMALGWIASEYNNDKPLQSDQPETALVFASLEEFQEVYSKRARTIALAKLSESDKRILGLSETPAVQETEIKEDLISQFPTNHYTVDGDNPVCGGKYLNDTLHRRQVDFYTKQIQCRECAAWLRGKEAEFLMSLDVAAEKGAEFPLYHYQASGHLPVCGLEKCERVVHNYATFLQKPNRCEKCDSWIKNFGSTSIPRSRC